MIHFLENRAMPAIPDVSDRSLAELVSFAGRSAVVTGAAWGLGKATARRLAEAGAKVLIADIDEDAAKASAAEIAERYDATVIATRMDAGDPTSIIAALDLAIAEFGGVDVWVNNAGVPMFASALDLPVEEFDKVVDINLRGNFVGAREFAKRLIAAGKGGTIVNVASLAGLRGISAGQSAYVASKHGVVGLTKQLAIELAPHGIRVVGIAPGVCLTEKTAFIADMDRDAVKALGIPGMEGSALGRIGVSDDIARVVLFAASDLAMYMSGTTLLVDGAVAA
ncbi:MAG: SDR family NAD(P)-dependent oxidoreductase [Novosphingobium sp.]